MSWTVTAEAVTKDFEFDDETIVVNQVRVEIYGQEFFLDPDQAHNLRVDIDTALFELGE